LLQSIPEVVSLPTDIPEEDSVPTASPPTGQDEAVEAQAKLRPAKYRRVERAEFRVADEYIVRLVADADLETTLSE
jgi:cell division septation protein DedD